MPHILGLITDLFFVSRVGEAAKSAGLEVQWFELPENAVDFVQRLANNPPALVVLDLNTSLPWPHWLPAAKADAATRNIPWLVFGSHMNPRRLAAARHAGADKVIPKSELDTTLQEMLTALK